MDVAALSLSVDSSSVVKAANDLDRFSAASAKAGATAGNQNGSIAKLVASVQSMDAKLSVLIGGLEKISAAQTSAAATAQKMASANDNVAKSLGQADSHVTAYRNHVLELAAAQRVAASAGARAATATVTSTAATAGSAAAATGAAAATTELAAASAASAVAAETSAVASGTAGASMLGLAGGAVATAAAIGVAVVAIAAFVGIIATVVFASITFADAYFKLRDEVGKGTEALGLNEKQLNRLKKAGVDTGVTLRDAFTGLGFAIGSALKDNEQYIKPLADAAKKVWADIVSFSSAALDTIVKTTIGTVAAIIAVWADIPNVMTDLFYQGVNKVIDGYNSIVKAGWDFFFAIVDTVAGIPGAIGDAFMGGVKLAGSAFDTLLDWGKAAFAALVYLWQNWPQILGELFIAGVKAAFSSIVWLYEKSRDAIKALWAGGSALVTGDVGPVANSATGAAAASADKATKAFNEAGSAYDKFKAKFAADFRKGTLDARNTRLTTAAGDVGKTPKGPKTDAEKLADIYRAAQAEIAVQETRAKAVGTTARAAAEMEERTKLLNQVEKANIPITSAVTAEINRLSKAYADAKIAADTKTAIQGVTDELVKQKRSVADQVALIGLYGDALNRARLEQEALNKARDALPRGEALSPEATAAIKGSAGQVADAQAAANQAARMEKVRKDAADSAYAMDLERKGLGLTGAAAESYAFVTERLNEAKRAGIELSPAEIAAIKEAGDAYGAQRYAIDQQKQAISDAREVVKGFWSDWINGTREGVNAITAFGNAAVNALNRIIDKLLDKAIDTFLDGISGAAAAAGVGSGSGSSGGSGGGATHGFALGGAFDQAQRFAKGGAFTNSIVNTPTLFRFANGAALGEMGEAGPEAVMPLKRGPNGALGVQMHGGGRPSIRMGDIHNTYKLDGAIGAEGIAAMVRQGGEATYNQVKRDLQDMLQQWGDGGAVSS